MANPAPSAVFIELAPRSLKMLVMLGGKVSAMRSFPLDAKADLTAFVAENSVAGSTRASLIGPKSFLHVSDETECASFRQPGQLLEHAAKLPHGFEGVPVAVAVDAFTGGAPLANPANPWVLTMVDAAVYAAAKQHLTELGLAPAELTLAAPIQFGAVAGSLTADESALVVMLGEEESQLVWVTAGGLSQCSSAPIGYASIYTAIQQGLGLKFKAAAGKLFFNENYDFTGSVSKIVEPLAEVLKPILDASPATYLHIVGLTEGQVWFASALAEASGSRVWAPRADQIGSGLAGSEAKPSFAGLLKLAAAGTLDAAWVQAPLDRIVAKAAQAKPAPVAVAKPVVLPKPVAIPQPANKSQTIPPTPLAAPAVAPATAAPVATPAVKPSSPGTVAPAKPAVATKAPTSTKSAAPFPTKPAATATRPPVPAKAPTGSATIPPVAAKAVPAQPAPAKQQAAVPAGAAPTKKSPILVIAVVVVLAAVGGAVFFLRGGAKAPEGAAAPVATNPVAANAPQITAPTPEAPAVASPPGTKDLLASEKLKYKNDRYAFEVTAKGVIQSLTGARNEVQVESVADISLQGSYTGPDGRKKWFNVGGVDDTGYQAVVKKSLREGITVFEVKVTHPRFEIEQTISCYAESIKVSARFKPINLRDPRGAIAAVHSIRLAPVALNPSARMRPTAESFNYTMKNGNLRVIFDPAKWARDGANELQAIIAGENSVAFQFSDKSTADANQLDYELTVP